MIEDEYRSASLYPQTGPAGGERAGVLHVAGPPRGRVDEPAVPADRAGGDELGNWEFRRGSRAESGVRVPGGGPRVGRPRSPVKPKPRLLFPRFAAAGRIAKTQAAVVWQDERGRAGATPAPSSPRGCGSSPARSSRPRAGPASSSVWLNSSSDSIPR